MSFDADIKAIKKLVLAVTGKDADVSITYRGSGYGITKFWNIKCNSREIDHETHEGAALEFVAILKKELQDKIRSTERQAADYQQILGSMEN